jgi:uncharacterized protein YacL
MIVRLARIVLVAAGAVGGYAVSQQIDWTEQTGYSEQYVIIIFIILGASIGYLFGGILLREFTAAFRRLADRLAAVDAGTRVFGAAGFVGGLLVAYLLSSSLFRFIEEPRWLGLVATVLLYAFSAYAGVSLVLLPGRGRTPTWPAIAASPLVEQPPRLLDTSAIIDGRFADLVRAGFLSGPLRVPRFVLEELQTLADSADDTKRMRGRRGLDLLGTLATAEPPVQVMEADFPDVATVDAKLVKLAHASGGSLVTTDYNLTKVARVEGVGVLNVNEAAEALRPVLLPGEAMRVAVTRVGKEPDQGVGYLVMARWLLSRTLPTRWDTRSTRW